MSVQSLESSKIDQETSSTTETSEEEADSHELAEDIDSQEIVEEQLEANNLLVHEQETDGETLIRGRYFVDSSSPLPELDSPTAKAYIVEDRLDTENQLFGLVCTPDLPTRLGTMGYLKRNSISSVMTITDWAPLYWPPLSRTTMIVIFKKPLGGRVLDRIKSKEYVLSGYDVPLKIAQPITLCLEKLHADETSYRAIRAENLFFLTEKMDSIVLGENVTSPPGFDQDSIYEPIERAMCQPEGRGMGSTSDDIFALGVTIGVLMTGKNPIDRLEYEEQIRARLAQGSYNAIFGSINLGEGAKEISLALVAPIRGMMHDDPLSRWTWEDIANWIETRQPKQNVPEVVLKAQTIFTHNKTDYVNPRILAFDFPRNVSEASDTIRNDKAFLKWLEHTLHDQEKIDAVNNVIQSAAFHREGHQGSDDYVVSKVCSIIDPAAPIRYKGLSFLPDGFTYTLAIAAARKNKFLVAGEVLIHDIVTGWLDLQEHQPSKIQPIRNKFTRLKKMALTNKLGSGLERALYETNPSLRCLSPYFSSDYVIVIQHLLPALNAAASVSDTQLKPVDRHIIAFIAARFDQDIRQHLKALNSFEDAKSIIGLLSLLAFLQLKLEESELLALSSWIGGLLGPAIESYHNQHTQVRIKKKLPQLVRLGSLSELFDLIDDPELRQKDQEEYINAKLEWEAAEKEIKKIETSREENTLNEESTGKQVAAMISISLGLVFVTIILILQIL